MKRLALALVLLSAPIACGGSSKPADAAAPAASSSSSPSSSAPPPSASTPPPVATADADAGAPAPVEPAMTTAVTTVSTEATTPNVVSPDQVITSLRPKFNECFQAGLKKDAKNASGSVTLSAKIAKDGKVTSVTPKMLTGFNASIVKCLTDKVKAASFAPAGGMSYTTSLDIPVGFSTNP